MLLALVSILLTTLSFVFVMGSMNLGCANRIIMYIPKEIFASSVPLLGKSNLIFDKDELENKVTSYYNTYLPKYTKKYEINFYYFDANTKSFCLDENCDYVEVNVKADIAPIYSLDRTVFYQITEGYFYGK